LNLIAGLPFAPPPDVRRIVLVAKLLLIEPKTKPGARRSLTSTLGSRHIAE
jgi:hypothetical protein